MFGKIVLNITSIIWSLMFLSSNDNLKVHRFSLVQCQGDRLHQQLRPPLTSICFETLAFGWPQLSWMLTNCLLLTAYWFVAFQLWNWWFSFSFGEDEIFEDPLHKYESIPLEFDDTNFVKKKLNTKSSESEDSDSESHSSVNYAYHPIIDFFNQSWLNNQYLSIFSNTLNIRAIS